MSYELMREFIFWGIWLVIPLMVDIITGIAGSVIVLKSFFERSRNDIEFLPHITILVPIYNSQKTLKNCLKSIVEQTYPIKNIMVFLINNGPSDGAYDIFCSFQAEYPRLRMWWADSSQGKAKALNKGLYMAEGKYIINIDSDGILDKDAIRKVVEKFENNQDIYAMTGVILTDIDIIEESKSLGLKLMQRCELFEYSEAFMIGRGFQSITNTMFTLAGAFSCYRKDAVLRTQLYNNETLGEDTHMTTQIREFLNGKVALCEEAFFFVDPVESWDKLYIQRQRWQRGQLEVTSLFRNMPDRRGRRLKDILKLTMVKDHTLVFPRFIWIFAMAYLLFMDYPFRLILGATFIMYFIYAVSSFLYFFISKLYLRKQKKVMDYMKRYWYTILILPLYRFIVFFIRVAGIINAVEKNAKWNAKTFTDERKIIREKLRHRLRLYFGVKDWVNNG